MADGPERIAVAGDLIVDWNIARAQEADRSATLRDPNYKAHAFSQLGYLLDPRRRARPSCSTRPSFPKTIPKSTGGSIASSRPAHSKRSRGSRSPPLTDRNSTRLNS